MHSSLAFSGVSPPPKAVNAFGEAPPLFLGLSESIPKGGEAFSLQLRSVLFRVSAELPSCPSLAGQSVAEAAPMCLQDLEVCQALESLERGPAAARDPVTFSKLVVALYCVGGTHWSSLLGAQARALRAGLASMADGLNDHEDAGSSDDLPRGPAHSCPTLCLFMVDLLLSHQKVIADPAPFESLCDSYERSVRGGAQGTPLFLLLFSLTRRSLLQLEGSDEDLGERALESGAVPQHLRSAMQALLGLLVSAGKRYLRANVQPDTERIVLPPSGLCAVCHLLGALTLSLRGLRLLGWADEERYGPLLSRLMRLLVRATGDLHSVPGLAGLLG